MGEGVRFSLTLCEILVAIVFGPENHILAIFIPKCTEGGGATV